jgi:uncharacterized protein
MRAVFSGALLAAAAAVCAEAQAPGEGCAVTESSVEALICHDASLAALDRALDGVLKAALAKAGEGENALRAEQAGWVQGRNDCSKAQENKVRGCVESRYHYRISELQAAWDLVPSKAPVTFDCGGTPAVEIVVSFFETDPPTARLRRGDRTLVAHLEPAGSGAKYEGDTVTLWTEGSEAEVTWDGTELACRAKP